MSAVSTVSLPRLLSICLSTVSQCNRIIEAVFRSGNLQTLDKSFSGVSSGALTSANPNLVADPQTVADLRSQALLFRCLRSVYPNLQLIGEENSDDFSRLSSVDTEVDQLFTPNQELITQDKHNFPDDYLNLPESELSVWIDPLDGTKEFTLGFIDGVTVLVGISFKQRPIAGVIGIPFDQGRVIWGAKGIGAFGLKTPKVDSLSRRIVTTRSHFTPIMTTIIDSLNPTNVLRSGGAGSKTLMILEGQADAYVFPSLGMKRWDTCACQAIIESAGGKLTDAYGEEILYEQNNNDYVNRNGVLATMQNHQSYVIEKQKFPINKL
jgi:3'(2'), 5'-bisphosphate nucleotidase